MPIIVICTLVVLGVIWATLANTPDWYRTMRANESLAKFLRKAERRAAKKKSRLTV